jgi:hypothetical protein
MKHKLLQITTITLATFLLFNNCRKVETQENTLIGGCTDIDSPIYDSLCDFEDASCLYAYVNQYEISYYPSEDPGASWPIYTWDDPISGANADLILHIWEQDNSTELFTSSEMSNQPYNTPALWTSPYNIKLLNKVYEWELVDYDATSGNDFIASGTFNPIELADNGTITTIGYHTLGNQTQLVLHYELMP